MSSIKIESVYVCKADGEIWGLTHYFHGEKVEVRQVVKTCSWIRGQFIVSIIRRLQLNDCGELKDIGLDADWNDRIWRDYLGLA
ncbi:hypothetical protein NCS52_00875900 [Fusarium sp. LHS14.1]|nr:hypothetical protein NCS52_00875900 [Fusarium sp. LHS14.1]